MNLSESLKSAADETLDDLVKAVGSVRAVVISTEDGFELVSRSRDASQVARLSAMASSMAALGVMAGEECDIGGFRSITLEAQEGFIVMLQARRPDSNFILSVISGPDALVGKVVLYGRKAVRQLQHAR